MKRFGLHCAYDERGFTFLEVMIAVAILSIAMVSLLRLVVGGIDNADYDKTVTLATLFAREKLNEALYSDKASIDAEGKGEEMYSMFTWERSITSTIFNRISQIKVVVTWPEGEQERDVTLSQFLYEK